MLNSIRDRVRVSRRDDRGVTLVEVLVAMVVSVILGAVTMRLVVMVNASAESTTDRTVSSARVSTALEAWSQYLEVADDPTASGLLANRFEWFTPNDVLFYADLYNRSGAVAATGAPTMLWLRRDSSGQLVEEQFPAGQTSFPATPSTCRILVTNVGSGTVFTPLDTSGNNLSATALGTAPVVAPGCQKLPAAPPSKTKSPNSTVIADLENIASVQIGFTVQPGPGEQALTFATTAWLPLIGGA